MLHYSDTSDGIYARAVVSCDMHSHEIRASCMCISRPFCLHLFSAPFDRTVRRIALCVSRGNTGSKLQQPH